MPGGDGTGPLALGPRTGRARGYCAGYPTPGFMNPNFGFGRRYRRFGGRGFGWRFVPLASPPQTQQQQVWEPVQEQAQASLLTKEQELRLLEDERKAIEQEQEALKRELEEVRKRIEELKE